MEAGVQEAETGDTCPYTAKKAELSVLRPHCISGILETYCGPTAIRTSLLHPVEMRLVNIKNDIVGLHEGVGRVLELNSAAIANARVVQKCT